VSSDLIRRRAADRLISPLLGLLFVRGRVDDIVQITPRMRLIGVTGPELNGLSWTPGQQVRVRVSDPFGGSALRTYSVWSYQEDRFELCILDHSDGGPGARWARGLQVRDEVLFRKPEGNFVAADPAPYHLFAGEETASVAFGAMLGALPQDARVYGAVEVPGEDDRLPLPRSQELTWCFRGNASAAASPLLPMVVRELDLPAEPGVAYLAGEARTCQAVRAHLVKERGWPRRSVRIKPFWAPGKRGLE
jgi:NADPH-dependent ferric siderophore reductase